MLLLALFFNCNSKLVQPTSEKSHKVPDFIYLTLEIWALVDYHYSFSRSGERQPPRSLLQRFGQAHLEVLRLLKVYITKIGPEGNKE